MAEFSVRDFRPADVPSLIPLWRRVFGDPEEMIADFFSLLPGMGGCVVAEQEGHIVGLSNVISGMELVAPGALPRTCGYVYAVAVDEDARHRGIGAALVAASVALAGRLGASVLCTLPAEPSLYEWYEQLMGVSCALRRTRYETACAPALPVAPLSAADYMTRREALLASRPHLRLTGTAADFAARFYAQFGGGLYACGGALCAAYTDGGCAYIKELVAPDGRDAVPVAASLGAFLGAQRAVYWLPSPDGEPYLSAAPGAVPPSCVWNLSFD